MAADWNNLQSVFGLQQSDINSLKSAGYSADQASQLLGLSIGGGGTGTTGTGGSSTRSVDQPSTIGGSGLSPQTLARLASVLGKGGGGTGDGNMAGGGPRNYQSVGVDPNQPLTNLGAAALDQNAIYNPQPGAGGIDPKSGVSSQQPAITTSGAIPNVQQGPWTRTPGVFVSASGAVSPGTQIAPQVKPGEQPTQQPTKYKGPTQINLPSAYAVPQPTPAAPVTPTPQATGMAYQPGQSWATPPPAPGLTFGGGGAVPMPMGGGGQPGGAPQNWQGAGQVPPTGRPSGGGVPGSAIALATGYVPGQNWNRAPGAGGSGGAAPSQPPVKRFAQGGIVTEPTLGLVGEDGPEAIVPLSGQRRRNQSGFSPEEQAYLQGQIAALTQEGNVNPNLQVSTGKGVGQGVRRPLHEDPRAFAQQTEAQQKEQGATGAAAQQGVQYAAQTNMPPGSPPAPPPPPQRTQPDRPRRGLQAPGVPTIDHSGQSSAQDYADWANSQRPGQKPGVVYDAGGNIVTSSPGLTAQAAAGAGATMDASGAIRDASGNIYDSSANLAAQDVGGAGATMPAGGAASGGAGAGMGNAIAGGIGAIGSAIQSLFSPSNIPSWKTQASAIPDPSSFKKQQTQYNLQTPSA